MVLAPLHAFALAGIEPPRYPEIWQCLGMVIGVYGVGYAIAARSPFRYWPIVFVGLLGKVLGPVGCIWYAVQGTVPWATFGLIVFNDLVWWGPFAAILVAARRDARRVRNDGRRAAAT